MADTLAEICAAKREHIARCKHERPLSTLAIKDKPRGFIRALRAKPVALIAEIKKASPSGGVIRADFDPESLAKSYAEGGAACLSVLTDAPYFQGCDAYLAQARDAVSLPVLRKDFMIDPYQIHESRALGADCVLLILAALEDAQAKELETAALELGMDVLIEVHDEKELDRARTHLRSPLIGVNNRNLKTLEVDLAVAERLAKKMLPPILPVCESGIRTQEDVKRMEKSGFSCFLVGESLMRQADVGEATRRLLGA